LDLAFLLLGDRAFGVVGLQTGTVWRRTSDSRTCQT